MQSEFDSNSEMLTYRKIEQAYCQKDLPSLETVIGSDLNQLEKDRNLGLAKLVLKRLQQK